MQLFRGMLACAIAGTLLLAIGAGDARGNDRKLRPPSAALPAPLALLVSIPVAIGQAVQLYASQYGEGARTASGEPFRPNDARDLTVAHRDLPFGTRLRITFGTRSVVARVNDRGPYVRDKHGTRNIDLSTATARALAFPGLGDVLVERLD